MTASPMLLAGGQARSPAPTAIRDPSWSLCRARRSPIFAWASSARRGKAEDYLPAQLANSILGEFGMMGRIGKSVREEKGLAYYAYSRLGGGHGPEPWSVSAGVNPENVDLAISIRAGRNRTPDERNRIGRRSR